MSAEDRRVLEERIRKAEKAERKRKLKEAKQAIKKEKVSFISDFKAFITRGNVLDLAIGVVIGAAFGKITSGLVSYIINPIISVITGGISLDNLRTPIGDEILDADGNAVLDALGRKTYEACLEWGQWIQTIIDFLLIALTIFVAVRIIRRTERIVKAKELAAKAEAEAQAKAEAEAKAAAEAAKAKAEAEAKAAIEAEFYANVREQTELLRKLAQEKK